MHFHKYQGAGNDFVILDNRAGNISLDNAQIARLCDRRFGIGADGLMLLEPTPGVDFRMVYYNADGGLSTLCGNGSRCMVAFAKRLHLIDDRCTFRAADGLHEGRILPNGTVAISMRDVAAISFEDAATVLDTGSPHFVQWVRDCDAVDVENEGRRIRNLSRFAPGGTNVNFVQALPGGPLRMRTYERGVEAETLSCGTGVTAAAIASACKATGDFEVSVETPGGNLRVRFRKSSPETAESIWLEGPAEWVFEGTI